MEKLLFFFLTVTFVLHGVAFTVLGVKRRKPNYFILTGTFFFLTTIYLIKFEDWAVALPGTSFPLTWLSRIGATVCSVIYLCLIYQEEGSWLWEVRHWQKNALIVKTPEELAPQGLLSAASGPRQIDRSQRNSQGKSRI